MDKIIDGVLLTPLKIIEGEKGSVLHAIKKTDNGVSSFGEAYFSTVDQNAVKGWKCHREMILNIVVPVGAIRFVIYDGRENSTSKGEVMDFVMGPKENYNRLTIPPGLWMAFQGKDKNNLLMNFASILHDPTEALNLPIENNELPKIKWQ